MLRGITKKFATSTATAAIRGASTTWQGTVAEEAARRYAEAERSAKRATQFEDAYWHAQNEITFRRKFYQDGFDKNGNPVYKLVEEEPFKQGKPYYPDLEGENSWAGLIVNKPPVGGQGR